MKEFIKLFVEFAVFSLIILFVGLLSYEMGEYKGLNNFCIDGNLIERPVTGEVVCELPNNNSTIIMLYNGEEVALNGD